MTTYVNSDGSDAAVEVDWEAGRRAFLRTCGLAAGAVALGVAGRPNAAHAADVTDVDVLNFALNLEYLEAEFYLRATTGQGLSDTSIDGRGALGIVVGGRKVNFDTKATKMYAQEIAADEEAHVKFLRAGLGSKRVARPKINLKQSFTAAATAAGLIAPGQKFDAFANETNFLLASFIFEDVGVTAYKGAAPLLADKGLLEAAAGILAVEAYHAGIIRTLLYQAGLFQEAKAISDARDGLAGTSKDQGIGNAKTANLVPADQDGVAYSRTVPEVKKVVYLNSGGTKGGFYPDGVNGAL